MNRSLIKGMKISYIKYILLIRGQAFELTSSVDKWIGQIVLSVWIFYFYDNKEIGKSCLCDSFPTKFILLLLLGFCSYLCHSSESHNLIGLILKMLNALISNTPSSQKHMSSIQSIKCYDVNHKTLV